jgi:hypothetical protein
MIFIVIHIYLFVISMNNIQIILTYGSTFR